MELDGATIGIIGGIVGVTAGFIGGVVGTRASVRNARSPAARAFMVRIATALWVVIGAMMGLLVLTLLGALPFWTYWAVFVPLMCCLGPLIVWTNRRLRKLESGSPVAGGATPPSRLSPRR